MGNSISCRNKHCFTTARRQNQALNKTSAAVFWTGVAVPVKHRSRLPRKQPPAQLRQRQGNTVEWMCSLSFLCYLCHSFAKLNAKSEEGSEKVKNRVLAGIVQMAGSCPTDGQVTRSVLCHGTHLGCGLGPRSQGAQGRQPVHVSLWHQCFSLSSSLPLILKTKNKNKNS